MFCIRNCNFGDVFWSQIGHIWYYLVIFGHIWSYLLIFSLIKFGRKFFRKKAIYFPKYGRGGQRPFVVPPKNHQSWRIQTSLRKASFLQNGWIFRKFPNGRFRKIYCDLFRKPGAPAPNLQCRVASGVSNIIDYNFVWSYYRPIIDFLLLYRPIIDQSSNNYQHKKQERSRCKIFSG